jgi:hypothetical protein
MLRIIAILLGAAALGAAVAIANGLWMRWIAEWMGVVMRP